MTKSKSQTFNTNQRSSSQRCIQEMGQLFRMDACVLKNHKRLSAALEEGELSRDLVLWVRAQTDEVRLGLTEVCVGILNLRTAHKRIEALYAPHTAERNT